MIYIHVTYVPFVDSAGELKTKPTQHSVNELRRIGIHPDIVVARSTEVWSADLRDKIAMFADIEPSAVIVNRDVPDVYLVPSALQEEGLDTLVAEKLNLPGDAGLGEWNDLTDRIKRLGEPVEINLVGKYVKLHDAYLSVHEALKHAGIHHGCGVRVRWVDAEGASLEEPQAELEQVDGVPRARRVRLARVGGEDHGLPRRARGDPYLGVCLGMRRGLGVRAGRGQVVGRQLDGDGSRDAVSGHRPPPGAEGDRGSRRHDAARAQASRARGGNADAGGVQRARRGRAPQHRTRSTTISGRGSKAGWSCRARTRRGAWSR